MKYGAIPIVRETGGLNDTVQAWNETTGEGNGFSFSHFNAHDMLYTIQRALHFYRDEAVWKSIVKQAMEKDYSWAQSAFSYSQLYAELVSRSETHVF
jgi:starch synthase